ncbi:MAG: universal stress protein [Proteobacteria bacterium]|uniref:universal stress protein n=1 Tax=Rudaea sp. TaxID=2136325 RepID=UPI001E0DC68F|nr:universal stress protein [Pseudomonadota bacterium]MBS0566854.1 universal stress protein [Pseudomonadota bacterium]
MFKHILVPTDGSRLSEKAVKQAVRLAAQIGARLTAFHVIPRRHPSGSQMQLLRMTAGDPTPTRQQHARRFLRYAERAAAAAKVDCATKQVTSDHPYKAIVAEAQQHGCDLILMASHGRRGIEGFLLGSETQKVLTHSRVPVLVYR